MDFLDYVTPRPYDIDLRNRIIERVQTAIGRTWFSSPGSVQCFGSFAAGLFLPTADMDLVYLSDKCRTTGREGLHCTKNDLYKIARKLKDKGVAIKTNVIPFAKVPIIKFEDTVTGLPVDVSFEKPDGLYAQTYFKTFKTQYESEMEILVAVIKQYLLMTDLNEVSTGGLGGLSVVCLVVSYLELFPQDVSKTPNQQPNYGVSLLGFLHYYGREFDLNKTRISMTPIGHVKKVRTLLKPCYSLN
jgi:non-canonical poly(A) RNA polymerase PAPD5/7